MTKTKKTQSIHYFHSRIEKGDVEKIRKVSGTKEQLNSLNTKSQTPFFAGDCVNRDKGVV